MLAAGRGAATRQARGIQPDHLLTALVDEQGRGRRRGGDDVGRRGRGADRHVLRLMADLHPARHALGQRVSLVGHGDPRRPGGRAVAARAARGQPQLAEEAGLPGDDRPGEGAQPVAELALRGLVGHQDEVDARHVGGLHGRVVPHADRVTLRAEPLHQRCVVAEVGGIVGDHDDPGTCGGGSIRRHLVRGQRAPGVGRVVAPPRPGALGGVGGVGCPVAGEVGCVLEEHHASTHSHRGTSAGPRAGRCGAARSSGRS